MSGSGLLHFKHPGVERAYTRHFSAAQLSLDLVFNGVLSAVTFSSSIKFWPVCTPLEKVLMSTLVLVSLAVPLAIWLRRDTFLKHREPLLAFKHLGEATIIAHVMRRKMLLAPKDYMSFVMQWTLFAPQTVWPILGIGFRFLLPGFLSLQTIYTVLVVACNGRMYDTLLEAYPDFMQRGFLGLSWAKPALFPGALSVRSATLAVWTALQLELCYFLPLYTVYWWELRDRRHFGRVRAARLPQDEERTISFEIVPLARRWQGMLATGATVAPLVVFIWAWASG